MKHVILALKGILFGISNAIAGVSGGTIAVITGIYDKLLNAINNIFKDFKNSIIFLAVFGIGAVIGFLGGSKVINICLQYAAIPTCMLFAGLVLGGVPSLGKPLIEKINIKNVLLAFAGIALVIGLLFVPENNATIDNLHFIDYLILFFCGFIAAVAMVTPGISGMMIFMLFGYFGIFNSTVSSLLDFSKLGSNLLVLLPIGVGILLGLFTAAKGISYLLEKFPVGTNFVIFGFVLASVFCILFKIQWEPNALMISLGCVTMIIGFLLTFLLEKYGSKKDEASKIETNTETVKD